eukprot:970231-Pelagomonas_calceolata.AAC.2
MKSIGGLAGSGWARTSGEHVFYQIGPAVKAGVGSSKFARISSQTLTRRRSASPAGAKKKVKNSAKKSSLSNTLDSSWHRLPAPSFSRSKLHT